MKDAELLQRCESHIRSGHIDQACLLLRDLNSAKIPDEYRYSFANLCRRVGLLSVGLKILSPPNMVDREQWLAKASPAEVAEYAILLQRKGSVNMALKVISGVSPADFPDTLLYRAYCHFNRWEYAEAIPLLEEYGQSSISEYKKAIGQVNLVAALLAVQRLDEAAALAISVLERALKGNFIRLQANCHELAAQVAIERFDLRQAKESLNAAAGILKGSLTLDQLFVRKGLSIVAAMETRSIEPLEKFRAEALERRDWESVRDVDLVALKLKFDKYQFEHLIFGTPFSAYRERACRILWRQPESESFLFGNPSGGVMDVQSGKINGTEMGDVGGKIHQLLEILLRDFYRPQSLGGLFSELFPDEYFDIYSSQDRVHQVLRRTRIWLTKSQLPVEIKEINQEYQIEFKDAFAFRVPLKRQPVDWNQILVDRIREINIGGRALSASELRSALKIGATPFRRFVTWAIEKRKLERFGFGPATRYCIADDSLATKNAA